MDRGGQMHRQMNKGTDEERIPNCQPTYVGATQDVPTVVVTARDGYFKGLNNTIPYQYQLLCNHKLFWRRLIFEPFYYWKSMKLNPLRKFTNTIENWAVTMALPKHNYPKEDNVPIQVQYNHWNANFRHLPAFDHFWWLCSNELFPVKFQSM